MAKSLVAKNGATRIAARVSASRKIAAKVASRAAVANAAAAKSKRDPAKIAATHKTSAHKTSAHKTSRQKISKHKISAHKTSTHKISPSKTPRNAASVQDRSFVVALARGLEVLRAFRPNDGLLGNQEIAARTRLPKPTVSRLTHTLTRLGYLTQIPRFEKYQLAPAAMALGYAALTNLGVRHLSESFRDDLMRATGGAVAIGGRDRLSMIYFGQSRSDLTVGVQLDVGSRVPIATSAMGRAYLWALPDDERSALMRDMREHYGARWPRIRDGIERAGEFVAAHGFAISLGEWQDDVHAAGVALTLNDGTGPYGFNCGAPAFRFSETRLREDIGPRLLTMVRNIEAALGGVATPAPRKADDKRPKGGRLARVGI